MSTINVTEEELPGLGQRFEFQLDARHDLTVVALRDGERQLTIVDRTDDTPVMATIRLDPDQAVTLGALLLGARFTIERPDTATRPGAVVVDTVAISARAPALGQTPSAALAQLDTDAVVLAVIRDRSGEIIEDHRTVELSEGDRVAIAVRPERHHDAIDTLAGGSLLHE